MCKLPCAGRSPAGHADVSCYNWRVSERQISKRNAQFQQWEALIGNRNKRQRAGEFLVQGVRPISVAIEHG